MVQKTEYEKINLLSVSLIQDLETRCPKLMIVKKICASLFSRDTTIIHVYPDYNHEHVLTILR